MRMITIESIIFTLFKNIVSRLNWARKANKVVGEIRVPKRGPGRPRTRPKRIIGDKACDSDPARKRLGKSCAQANPKGHQ